MRHCSGCDRDLSTDEFYPNKSRKDGFQSWCKSCCRADWQTRREADPEKTRAKWVKDWNKNREKKMARTAAWWKAHPEKNVAKVLKWSQENPFKVKSRHVAYDARRRAAAGGVTPLQIENLINLYRGLCAYCANRANTLDHVVPLSRGGRHDVDNLLPACVKCNSSKGAKLVDQWLALAA